MTSTNICVCCGEIIPEDLQVCPSCEDCVTIGISSGMSRDEVIRGVIALRRAFTVVEEAVDTLLKAFRPVGKTLIEALKEVKQLEDTRSQRGRKPPKPWETSKRRFYD